MFLIRRSKPEDAPTLLKLARMVHFINLPADKDIIAEKVQWSRQCFAALARRARPDGALTPESTSKSARHDPAPSTRAAGLAALHGRSKIFMFTLEDTESRGVLGTSQIITSMGGPGNPNLHFELSRKEMFSTNLQVGSTHITAKLKLDESGPTEIGGLILQPSYRGHKARLGRFLSLARFHFMGMYRPMVAGRVIAEMMGPITPDGQNTLWEYLGRRFINLTYIEADRFCQYSKEFMLTLLPREEIYLTLLPPEARRIIAQVGPETEPARRMLEDLGFEYRNCIDPFDGGPTLEAATDDISVVKAARRLELGEPLAEPSSVSSASPSRGIDAMVSTLAPDGEFTAVQARCEMDGKGRVRLPRDEMSALAAEPGATVGFTPFPAGPKKKRAASLPSVEPQMGGAGNGHSVKPAAKRAVKPRTPPHKR